MLLLYYLCGYLFKNSWWTRASSGAFPSLDGVLIRGARIGLKRHHEHMVNSSGSVMFIDISFVDYIQVDLARKRTAVGFEF